MSRALSEVTRNVEKLLKEYPQTRNSDKELVARYMIRYHGFYTFWQALEDDSVPSYESIRRARQKIQACGKYPPAEKITDIRYEKEAEYHNYFR